jgi:Tol biopolymer transport system component
MAARDTLARAGLVEGALLQRLAWETGDPAISPDGSKAAIVLRDRVTPARVVIWTTAEEPEDTAAIRRRIEALKRDPQDVPDRRFFPRPKKALKTLPAINGRSFQHPRWFPDNRRVLLTRWSPRPDGATSPDLWIWDTETDETRKVTHGTGVLLGDVAPDGRDAVAMQCHWGHCDVVRVDLARGAMRTLLEGNAEQSYFRPRYSPDGTRIAASFTENGRWRVVVADREGKLMRSVDPGDGANRFDAAWLGNDSLIVVSDAGGIANLEIIEVASGAATPLTRVTGAALAPERNPADGSLWFLSMHAGGLDVRRIARGAEPAGRVVPILAAQFGFAGMQAAVPRPIPPDSIGRSRRYGLGPRVNRWLPGGSMSGDGVSGMLSAFSGDIVGRLNVVVTGSYGQTGTVQGGSLRAAWRRPRPALELGVHGFLHEPSLGRHAIAGVDSIDAAVLQGVIGAAAFRTGDGWSVSGRVGGSAGSMTPQRQAGTHFRGLGFGEVTTSFLQGRGGRSVVERFSIQSVQGHTRAAYQRAVGTVQVETSGAEIPDVQLRGTFGRLVGSPHPFERFTIGGAAMPVGDSTAMNQRYALPMLPTGVASGDVLMAWRIAIPSNGWTLFYEGASAGDSLYGSRPWHRAAGIEIRADVPPISVVFTPRIRGRVGAAYMLDPPFRKRVRGFLAMQFEP